MLTQDMYDVVKQPFRNINIKVNILDKSMNIVDTLQGKTIKFPTLHEDVNSDLRRSCDIDMIITDYTSSYITEQLFIDKNIQIYIGIDSVKTGEIIWFNEGIYLINNPTITISKSGYEISFKGIDLMANLTGLRNGVFTSLPYVIPVGSNIRQSVIALLQSVGIEDYIINIDTAHTETLYEIKTEAGATIYDILSKLRDMYVDYEIYFDIDGVFHYEKIPTEIDENVLVSDDLWNELLISVKNDIDYTKVKNYIIVNGRTHNPDGISSNTTVDGNVYNFEIAGLSLGEYTIVSGQVPVIVYDPQLSVGETIAHPIVDVNGEQIHTLPDTGVDYVFLFKDNTFEFLGHIQTYGIARDLNPDSPFNINKIQEIKQVFSGGEYDDIYSDELAKQRAEWELYKSSRLNDNLTITCVPIYWLTPHKVVEITLKGEIEPKKYLIQSIETGETQTIHLSRYYGM